MWGKDQALQESNWSAHIKFDSTGSWTETNARPVPRNAAEERFNYSRKYQ